MTPEGAASSHTRWGITALVIASLILQLMALVPGLWAGSGGDPAGTVIGRELASLYAQIAALLCLLVANTLALMQRRALPVWDRLAPPLILVFSLLGWYWVYALSEKPEQRSMVKDGVEYVEGRLESNSLPAQDKIISMYFMDYVDPPPRSDSLEGDHIMDGSSKPRMISLNRPKHIRWYIWKAGEHDWKNGGRLKDPSVPVIVCDATVVPYVSPLMDKIYDRSQGENWRAQAAIRLAATFYGDGKTMGLTIPWGVSNGHPDYNADILTHTVQGDCR